MADVFVNDILNTGNSGNRNLHAKYSLLFRWKNDPERHAEGVVPPPRDPNAPAFSALESMFTREERYDFSAAG